MSQSPHENQSPHEKRMHEYLDAVDSIQQSHVDVAEEKRQFVQVMKDIGISEEEQRKIEAVAVGFLQQGQELFVRGEEDLAVEYAQKARKLLPFDLRPLELLLAVYTKANVDDTANVRVVAERILQLQPHHLQAQKALRVSSQESDPNESMFSFAKYVAMAVVLSVFAYKQWISAENNESIENDVPTVSVAPSTPTEPSTTTKPATPLTDELSLQEAFDRTPESLEFVVQGSIDGVDVLDGGSSFSGYIDSYSVQIRSLLVNNSTAEVGEILGNVSLVDIKGNVVVQKNKVELRADYLPMLRKGQSDSLDVLIYQDKLPKTMYPLQKIEISLEKLEHQVAPSHIALEDVELRWPNGDFAQYSLRVQKRTSTKNFGAYNDLMKEYYTENVYEITNVGEGVIRALTVEQSLYDNKGNLLVSDKDIIAYSSTASIAPQETRLALFLSTVKSKPSKAVFSVLEIE
jgi:hypothetical protein